jgi:uncharacterized membrane protein
MRQIASLSIAALRRKIALVLGQSMKDDVTDSGRGFLGQIGDMSMELSIKLVLWVHLISLALAGCSVFALPMVLRLMGLADPAQRPALGQVVAKLASFGRMALVLLILSGTYLLAAKYGGVAGLNGWFHLKMLLVVLLCALAIFNLFNARKARAGDVAAAARMPVLAKIGGLLVLAIVASAVFAFS